MEATTFTGTIAPIERMVGGNGTADNGGIPMDTSVPNGAGNSSGRDHLFNLDVLANPLVTIAVRPSPCPYETTRLMCVYLD